MENKLIEIASKVFGINKEDIFLESSNKDIKQWDSLAHLNLISEVEEQFGITIPLEEIPNIRKLSDFLMYLKKDN